MTSTPNELSKFAKEEWAFNLELYDKVLDNIIDIPPLRHRPEDIPVLALNLVRRFAKIFERPVETIDRELLNYLSQQPFPGNTAELESLIEAAVLRCQDKTLKMEHLP